MSIVIDKNLCPQTHSCPMIQICPAEAISQDGFLLPLIDHDLCLECGACIQACRMGAVSESQE